MTDPRKPDLLTVLGAFALVDFTDPAGLNRDGRPKTETVDRVLAEAEGGPYESVPASLRDAAWERHAPPRAEPAAGDIPSHAQIAKRLKLKPTDAEREEGYASGADLVAGTALRDGKLVVVTHRGEKRTLEL